MGIKLEGGAPKLAKGEKARVPPSKGVTMNKKYRKSGTWRANSRTKNLTPPKKKPGRKRARHTHGRGGAQGSQFVGFIWVRASIAPENQKSARYTSWKRRGTGFERGGPHVEKTSTSGGEEGRGKEKGCSNVSGTG